MQVQGSSCVRGWICSYATGPTFERAETLAINIRKFQDFGGDNIFIPFFVPSLHDAPQIYIRIYGVVRWNKRFEFAAT